MSSAKTIAALQAAQSALNQMPRQKLTGPHRTSYAVASLVDAALQAETQEPTAPHGIYSLCEAVADLSAMFARSQVIPGDSREMCGLCIEWAAQFEAAQAPDHVWGETDNREYIEEIEKWFRARYAKWQATAHDVCKNEHAIRPNFIPHALANSARICIELPESMQAGAIIDYTVSVAATALAEIECEPGFSWEGQRIPWEETCAGIAARMVRGAQPADWAKFIPKLLRKK